VPVWRYTEDVIRRVLERDFDCEIGQRHVAEDDEDYYVVITWNGKSAFLFVKEFEVVPVALLQILSRLGIDQDELFAALQREADLRDSM
jgi:hypothetical protein